MKHLLPTKSFFFPDASNETRYGSVGQLEMPMKFRKSQNRFWPFLAGFWPKWTGSRRKSGSLMKSKCAPRRALSLGEKKFQKLVKLAPWERFWWAELKPRSQSCISWWKAKVSEAGWSPSRLRLQWRPLPSSWYMILPNHGAKLRPTHENPCTHDTHYHSPSLHTFYFIPSSFFSLLSYTSYSIVLVSLFFLSAFPFAANTNNTLAILGYALMLSKHKKHHTKTHTHARTQNFQIKQIFSPSQMYKKRFKNMYTLLSFTLFCTTSTFQPTKIIQNPSQHINKKIIKNP